MWPQVELISRIVRSDLQRNPPNVVLRVIHAYRQRGCMAGDDLTCACERFEFIAFYVQFDEAWMFAGQAAIEGYTLDLRLAFAR